MAGVQVTVDIPIEQLAKVSDNIFEAVTPEIRAEIVSKAALEILRNPELLRKDAEEEARSRGLREKSWEWDKFLNSRKDIREKILHDCYERAMRGIYQELKETVMESDELKGLMGAVTAQMTKNCKEIIIAVMTESMVKHLPDHATDP